jgi:hypothetical protein
MQGPGFEFGTSSGRQGVFDPTNAFQRDLALKRLRELQGAWGDVLQPNFTGYTGLGSGDARGYSDLLNARTEALNIQRILGGNAPMNIRYGGRL